MPTLTETQAQPPRFIHLRAYLVGTGATGALIAAAVIVFLSLATYVAFNGMPFAGEGGNSGNSYIGVQAAGTPTSAAAALRAAPGAVAASPVPGARIGAGAAGAFTGGRAGPGGGGGNGFNPGGGTGPGGGGPQPPRTTPGPGGRGGGGGWPSGRA